MATIVAGFTAGMVVLAASDGGWARLVYPVVMAPVLWVSARWLRLRVEVDGHGLRIVNSKAPEIFVPWSQVGRFDLGGTILFGSRIVCVTRDGQRIGLDVFTGAWWVRWESWSRWTPTRRRLAELNSMLANRAAPSSVEGWSQQAGPP